MRGWLEPALPVELSAPVEQPSFPAEPPKESPFPQKPVFPKDAAFGKEPAFGQESAFGQDSGFGKDSAFGQESAFGVEREESFAPPESGPHVVGAPPSRSPAGFKDDRFTGSLRDDLSGEERQSYERDHGSADERQPYGRDRGAERQPYERDHGAERQPYDRDHGAERQPYDRDHGAERQPYDRDRGIERQPYERDRGNVAEQEPYQPRRRQAPQVSAFSSPARAAGGKPPADSLDPVSLLKGRRNAPAGGWRKLVYKASAGWIKPGEPPEVRRRRELINRARTPVATGHHRVAVLSLKGGVGKTTTTVGLGATLAQVRGDRVIAVDANPDRGTLSDKVELETSATVRDLLNERAQIKRYVDIRAFTSQAPSRLEILASDRDPSVSEAFSAKDYHAVSQVLENFYSICITDCGTGLLHSAMSGVLGLADQIVLVSSPSVDGARAASATLDWLEAHHYGDLVKAATVVLCSVRPRSKSTVDLDRLEAHFAARCRAVVRVPYDPHLEEGAEIDLDRLQEATREAYLRLAASVGDGFAGPQALGERRFSEIPDQL
ncbi:AAA family ATPase [Planotetraspora sp. A-T 1434]|nr:AAA family ATPase [Planotetraspora sp. A-T 1434]MCT9931729.1 AAA family ATPase [Planotetraspora sp. A-T 1434]